MAKERNGIILMKTKLTAILPTFGFLITDAGWYALKGEKRRKR